MADPPLMRCLKLLVFVLLHLFSSLLKQICDQSCPARLVAGTDTCAVITVEVLVEQQEVAPVRVILKCFNAAMNRPQPIFVAQENARQAARQFFRYLVQREQIARTGGKLDLEALPVEVVKRFQRLDYQVIEREPDWPTPVRVTTEQTRGGLRRFVINTMAAAIHF